jgi:hypothetical protein
VVAFFARRLIYPQLRQRGRVVRRPRPADPVVEHRPDALRVDLHDLGNTINRHFPFNQGKRQRFE